MTYKITIKCFTNVCENKLFVTFMFLIYAEFGFPYGHKTSNFLKSLNNGENS